ncbi:MAG: RpiB/LacA/LacB family sugar-phosphate isomerase [Acidimicrobiia bacterium]
MRVVVGSDEQEHVVDVVVDYLRGLGHTVDLVGPPGGGTEQWAEVGHIVGRRVADGTADTGVLFCWTGTGASIAANKVAGVRAALCTDASTAEGARRWNDANILVMGLRLTSPTSAREMLDAWLSTGPEPTEADNIARAEHPDA